MEGWAEEAVVRCGACLARAEGAVAGGVVVGEVGVFGCCCFGVPEAVGCFEEANVFGEREPSEGAVGGVPVDGAEAIGAIFLGEV